MNRFWKVRGIALALSMILLAVMLAAAVSGCGGNTPSSAAGDMVQMLSDRQFGEAYDSFSSASPVREIKREDFISQMEASLPEGTTITEFSVTEEKIDGDKATVTWKAKVKMPNVDRAAPRRQLCCYQGRRRLEDRAVASRRRAQQGLNTAAARAGLPVPRSFAIVLLLVKALFSAIFQVF